MNPKIIDSSQKRKGFTRKTLISKFFQYIRKSIKNRKIPRIGVFQDFENIAHPCKNNVQEFRETQAFIDKISTSKGKIVCRNAYFKRQKEHDNANQKSRKEFLEIIEKEFHWFLKESYWDKDIDTIMLADILESLYTNLVDIIIIVSGDTDFRPALETCKKLEKESIVIAYRDTVRNYDGLPNFASSTFYFSQPCPKCNGTGIYEEECRDCQGTGIFSEHVECRKCHGTGQFQKGICYRCIGTKRIEG